jgi:hypothetical protein
VRGSVPPRRYDSLIALFSSICESSNCLEEGRCDTLMEDDVGVVSRFAIDVSIMQYKDKDFIFSQIEGVDHEVTIDLDLFQGEGINLVQVFPVVGCFEEHERDFHVHGLLVALDGLLHIPRAWCFMIDELTWSNSYLCDFDRYDTLVLVLYGDVIIFAGHPRYLMMWCPNILTSLCYLREVGVWHISYDSRLYSFVFTGG